jgi:hypothetical protein
LASAFALASALAFALGAAFAGPLELLAASARRMVDGVGWEDFQIFQSGDVRIFSL